MWRSFIQVQSPCYLLYDYFHRICRVVVSAESKSRWDSNHPTVTLLTGKDFYIALMDHEDWSLGHTAWAVIDDLSVVETILQEPFTDQEHIQYGTHMRMMDNPMHFTLQLTEL